MLRLGLGVFGLTGKELEHDGMDADTGRVRKVKKRTQSFSSPPPRPAGNPNAALKWAMSSVQGD